jgi:hypothetical protein
LNLLRWERHVHPDAGRPQDVINRQIRDYDIFIGVMWKWYGMPSGAEGHEEESGTAEELRLALEKHKRNSSLKLLFYFIEEPFWPKSEKDIEQMRKVLLFRKQIKGKLLTKTVKDRPTFVKQVGQNLEEILSGFLKQRLTQPADKPVPAEDPHITFRSINMLVDLKTREQLTNMDGFDVSKTTKCITAVVKDADHGTTAIRFRHATQGHCIKLLDDHLREYWKRSGTDDPAIFAPSLEHLQENEHFEKLRSLKGRLDQSYYLNVPYTGPNQEIRYTIEIYNGYQPSAGDWTGVILVGDVDECELCVRFPAEKEPSDFVTRKGDPTVTDSFEIVTSNQNYDPDNHTFKWKFFDGRRGEAYEISWKW